LTRECQTPARRQALFSAASNDEQANDVSIRARRGPSSGVSLALTLA
jgi:hypothetical protein